MWRIDLNNATLHQAGSEYTLLNPVLTCALNAVDKLEFDITTAHPLYDVVRDGIMSQNYHVMLDGETVSRGRILSCTEQPLTSTMHVICEGDLGRLNDAVMEPYNVDGAAKSAYTVFNSYIDAYSRYCGSIYPIYTGNVTINDNQLVRSNESPSNVFEELMEKTVNSSTGGYVGVRYDAQNKCFIDWLESPNVAGAQNVTAGINILELSDERNGANIITAILPVGATNDDGTRVLPDADRPDGSYVKGDVYYRSFPWSYTVTAANNTTVERNACVLYNKKLVNKYGWHCAVVTWEDVTLSINLWNKAIKYTRELAFKNKIDVRAVDLADAGYIVDRFKPGQRVPVRCGQLDSTMMVQSCEWHLDDPSATVISFGESVTSTSYTSSATATANNAANAASAAVAMASSAPTKYAPISHTHAASDVTNGTLDSARLPKASTSTLGAVKVDGSTITADANGVISATGGGADTVSGVKGNAESTYRTGNVNLTPANIGAANATHTHSASDITSGLATVATSGSYNDLSNKPTLPTVGNTTVFYGTCATAASTQAKAVTCADFAASDLKAGTVIYVKMTNNQTYNGAPTLNVNSTGAVAIKYQGTTNAVRYEWRAGEVICFIHDGTNWIIADDGRANTSYYGVTKLSTSATSTSTDLAAAPSAINSLVQNMIEPYAVYSSSSTYAVGDRVRYNYQAWECTTAITTAESWNAAHWTALPSVQEQLDDKVDTADLATVATTGAYSDLSGKPTIPSASSATPLVDGTASAGSSTDYARADHVHPTDTSRAAAVHTHSASDITSGLAAVATSGSYNDLSGKPTIPSASSASPQMDGTASAGSSSDFSRADHVHPTDTSRAAAVHTHAASDITSGLATVATSGSYNDLTDKPTIPAAPVVMTTQEIYDAVDAGWV